MRIWLLFILAISPWDSVLGEPVYRDRHYPAIQLPSAPDTAYFSILAPRLRDFSVTARPSGKPKARPRKGTALGEPLSDPEGKLHDKVVKFKIPNLQPDTEYTLEIFEDRWGKPGLVDTRTFRTPPKDSKKVKWVFGSCMCDERRYADTMETVWTKLLQQKPEAILLAGDQVYVDSFDYVQRHQATELDIWQRYLNSMKTVPLFRATHLVPVAAVWDDHDVGVDNSNKRTPTLEMAERAHQAIYGSPTVPGIHSSGKTGLYRQWEIGGQRFFLLDTRSFRDPSKPDARYGHLGRAQEDWLLRHLKANDKPAFLILGDQWVSEAQYKPGRDRPLNESMASEHPTAFAALMKRLGKVKAPLVFLSGDVHFSEVTSLGPEWAGTNRYFPYPTAEITSSPLHSFIFRPKPGEPALWPNPGRIVGVKDHNFTVLQTEVGKGGVDVQLASIGTNEGENYRLGLKVEPEATHDSHRRQWLSSNFKKRGKKVKVAFLDADSTIRIAPSGKVTASTPTDVRILSGVADGIAKLNKEGYLVAVVSNQGGVAEGYIPFQTADQALRHTVDLIEKENPQAKIHYYDFSERGEGDHYHKPNTGMYDHLAMALAREGLEIDRAKSIMVGDSLFTPEDQVNGKPGKDFSNADRRFAENCGLRFLAPQSLGWAKEIGH